MHLGKSLPGILRSLPGGWLVRSELPDRSPPPLWLACPVQPHAAAQLLWALAAPPEPPCPARPGRGLWGFLAAEHPGFWEPNQAGSSLRVGRKQPLPSGTNLVHSNSQEHALPGCPGTSTVVCQGQATVYGAGTELRPLLALAVPRTGLGAENGLRIHGFYSRALGMGVSHPSEAHSTPISWCESPCLLLTGQKLEEPPQSSSKQVGAGCCHFRPGLKTVSLWVPVGSCLPHSSRQGSAPSTPPKLPCGRAGV